MPENKKLQNGKWKIWRSFIILTTEKSWDIFQSDYNWVEIITYGTSKHVDVILEGAPIILNSNKKKE